MTNFYDFHGNKNFDPKTYLLEWEKFVLNGRVLSSLPGKQRLDHFQKLKAQVKALWRSFNGDRTDFPKHYMDDQAYLQAYVAAFLTPNIQRVYSILTQREVARELHTIIGTVNARAEPVLSIIDFGAGPLSATVGLLCALHANGSKKLPKIHIHAVERSAKIFEIGKQLLSRAIPELSSVEISLHSSIDKIQESADIILSANVMNEIPEKHWKITTQKLLEKLSDDGVCLLLEPGKDAFSKSLCTLRDEIVTEPALGVHLISPCLHAQACPLSSKTDREDWCWFRSCWTRPPLLEEVDHFTGLDHTSLSYTFFVFQKREAAPSYAPECYARNVSDPIHMQLRSQGQAQGFLAWAKCSFVQGDEQLLQASAREGESLCKQLLCTRKGDLESEFCKVPLSENDFAALPTRGSSASEKTAGFRCRERVLKAAPAQQNKVEKFPMRKPAE